jgi:UDP-GlcNAc:undecaprenyl-phosphate GlcNAc-1-phosphate transferase
MRPLAIRLGLVDAPGGRKQHHGEVPLIGGIGIFLGFSFAIMMLPVSLSDYRSFLASCILLTVVGVLDDFHELAARSRFIAQIIAGLFMVCWGNVALHHLGDLLFLGDINLHNWALPFTVISVVGLINAVNMTDGLDGLAGGITLVEFFMLIILAIQSHLGTEAQILCLIASALIGFLYFNCRLPRRSHAIVFMGDAGSMLLGFTLVWFLISLSQGDHPAAKPATMLWVMTIPLFDMVSVILRRLVKKKSPFSADREHIHHLFQVLGFSNGPTVLILCGLSFLFGIIGITAQHLGADDGTLFVGFISLFLIYFISSHYVWQKVFQGNIKPFLAVKEL